MTAVLGTGGRLLWVYSASSSQGTLSGNLGPRGAAGGLLAFVMLREVPRGFTRLQKTLILTMNLMSWSPLE